MTDSKNFKVKLIELMSRKQVIDGKRLTLADVSRGTGIAYSTLLRWDRGDLTRLDLAVISSLCAYFSCTMAELIEYSPPGLLAQRHQEHEADLLFS